MSERGEGKGKREGKRRWRRRGKRDWKWKRYSNDELVVEIDTSKDG
jgi:hypothetical protein